MCAHVPLATISIAGTLLPSSSTTPTSRKTYSCNKVPMFSLDAHAISLLMPRGITEPFLDDFPFAGSAYASLKSLLGVGASDDAADRLLRVDAMLSCAEFCIDGRTCSDWIKVTAKKWACLLNVHRACFVEATSARPPYRKPQSVVYA